MPESMSTDLLMPESKFIVSINNEGISCQRPDGAVESVLWADLRAVLIETNDEGPFACDVMWVLVGKTGGCVIPQGATGEQELLARLQELPGFRNEAVIQAMGCADNARFLCWRRNE